MYQFRSTSVVNESFYCFTSSTKYNNLCLCSGIMMMQCCEIAHLICSWSWIFAVFQLLSCVQCLQCLRLQHPQASLSYAIYQSLSNSCSLSQWCHQPPHSLLPPSPPAFNLSQHQGLFQRVSSSHQVTKVLELQFQHQSFQWVVRVDFL